MLSDTIARICFLFPLFIRWIAGTYSLFLFFFFDYLFFFFTVINFSLSLLYAFACRPDKFLYHLQSNDPLHPSMSLENPVFTLELRVTFDVWLPD